MYPWFVLSAQAPTPVPLPALRQQIDRGQAGDALIQLDALHDAHPNTAGVERLRGLALYALGRYAEAAEGFRAALSGDNSDAEARQMLGLTLFRLGKPAEAIPLLEAAHAWNPDTRVDPTYVLALCYIDSRRYDDARHAFALQYGFPPDSASAYLLAARLLLRREYVPVALEFARKALALNPELPLAHGLLGEVALSLEHLDEAIAEFELERTRNPLDGSVYDRLGDAYSRKGEYIPAERALERALLLEPNSTGPYILLGKVLLKRGDPSNAQMYLERAVKMDSSNFMSHSLLGQAYRMIGRKEDAAHELALSRMIQAGNEPKLAPVH